MYADSMLTHHKYGLPVENSTGTSEYLRLVNNKVGAGSILRVKTVTSGYSLQPQHFHLIESDAKYLYDVEILIKMRHSDAHSKLQEIMTDFPITCLLQRVELQKLLLDIVGSAVMLPNSTVNASLVDHYSDGGNSSGHVTPLLAVKSLVYMFKKAAQHFSNEMPSHLTTTLPVCASDGSSSAGATALLGTEIDQTEARMAEDNNALVYAIYKLRYPVYFSSYHSLASMDKVSNKRGSSLDYINNARVYNLHAKSAYYPSLPGYAFAICAATIKLLKMTHSCPSVFVEAGSSASGVSSNELVLSVYESVAMEVLPFIYEPTSLLHTPAASCTATTTTAPLPVPLSKVEVDRIQYLLSAINEVIGYHGVDELMRGCSFNGVGATTTSTSSSSANTGNIDSSPPAAVVMLVIKYFSVLLSSIPVDRVNHVCVQQPQPKQQQAASDPACPANVPHSCSHSSALLDLYYDHYVVTLLRRVCTNVALRHLLASELQQQQLQSDASADLAAPSNVSLLTALDRLVLILDPEFSTGVAQAQRVVSAFHTLQFLVHNGDTAADAESGSVVNVGLSTVTAQAPPDCRQLVALQTHSSKVGSLSALMTLYEVVVRAVWLVCDYLRQCDADTASSVRLDDQLSTDLGVAVGCLMMIGTTIDSVTSSDEPNANCPVINAILLPGRDEPPACAEVLLEIIGQLLSLAPSAVQRSTVEAVVSLCPSLLCPNMSPSIAILMSRVASRYNFDLPCPTESEEGREDRQDLDQDGKDNYSNTSGTSDGSTTGSDGDTFDLIFVNGTAQQVLLLADNLLTGCLQEYNRVMDDAAGVTTTGRRNISNSNVTNSNPTHLGRLVALSCKVMQFYYYRFLMREGQITRVVGGLEAADVNAFIHLMPLLQSVYSVAQSLHLDLLLPVVDGNGDCANNHDNNFTASGISDSLQPTTQVLSQCLTAIEKLCLTTEDHPHHSMGSGHDGNGGVSDWAEFYYKCVSLEMFSGISASASDIISETSKQSTGRENCVFLLTYQLLKYSGTDTDALELKAPPCLDKRLAIRICVPAVGAAASSVKSTPDPAVYSSSSSLFTHDRLRALSSIAFSEQIRAERKSTADSGSGSGGSVSASYNEQEQEQALYQLVLVLSGENPSCHGLLRNANTTWCINIFRYCMGTVRARNNCTVKQPITSPDTAQVSVSLNTLVNTLLLAEVLLRELPSVRACCYVSEHDRGSGSGVGQKSFSSVVTTGDAGSVNITPLFKLLLLPNCRSSDRRNPYTNSSNVDSNTMALTATFLALKCVQYYSVPVLLRPVHLQHQQSSSASAGLSTSTSSAVCIPDCYRCVYGNVAFDQSFLKKPAAKSLPEAVMKLPPLSIVVNRSMIISSSDSNVSANTRACTSRLVVDMLAQHQSAVTAVNFFSEQLCSICSFVKNPTRSPRPATPALGIIQLVIEKLQALHSLVTLYPNIMVPLILTTTVTEPLPDSSRLLLLDSLKTVLGTIPPCQVSVDAVNDNIILNLVLSLLIFIVQYLNNINNFNINIKNSPSQKSCSSPEQQQQIELRKGLSVFCTRVFECLMETLLPAKCAQILAGFMPISAVQQRNATLSMSSNNYNINSSIPYDSPESLADPTSYYASNIDPQAHIYSTLTSSSMSAVTGRQLSTRRQTNNITLEKRVISEELVKVYNEGLRVSQTRTLKLFIELLSGNSSSGNHSGDASEASTVSPSAQSVIEASEEMRVSVLISTLLNRWLRQKTDAVLAGDATTAAAVAQNNVVTKLMHIFVSERESSSTRELAGKCLFGMCLASGGHLWSYLRACDDKKNTNSSVSPITSSVSVPEMGGAKWSVQVMVRVAKRLRLPDSVRGSAVSRWCLLLITHYSSTAAHCNRYEHVSDILASCTTVVPASDAATGGAASGDVDANTSTSSSNTTSSTTDSEDGASARASASNIHCDTMLTPRTTSSVSSARASPEQSSSAIVVYDWTWVIHLLHSRFNATKALALELVFNMCCYFMYHRGLRDTADTDQDTDRDTEYGRLKSASIPWNLLTAVQNCVTSVVTSISTPHVECLAVRTSVLRIMYTVFQHPTASVRALNYPMSAHEETEKTSFDSGICTILAQICAALTVNAKPTTASATANASPTLRTSMQYLKTHVDLLLHIVITQCSRSGADATLVLTACKDLKLFARLVHLLSPSYFATYVEDVKAKLLRNLYEKPADEIDHVGVKITGGGTGWDKAFAVFVTKESHLYLKTCIAAVRLFQFLCSSTGVSETRVLYSECVQYTGLLSGLFASLRNLQSAATHDRACVGRDWLVLSTLQYDLLCGTVTLLLGNSVGTSNSVQTLDAFQRTVPELLHLIANSLFHTSDLLMQLLLSVCLKENNSPGISPLFSTCVTLVTSCLRLLATVTDMAAGQSQSQCSRALMQSCFLSLLLLRRVVGHYSSSIGSGSANLHMDTSLFTAVAGLAGAVPVVQGALQLQISVAVSYLLQRCHVFPRINDFSFGLDSTVVAKMEKDYPSLLTALLMARNLDNCLLPPIASATALVSEICHSFLKDSLECVCDTAERLTAATETDVAEELEEQECRAQTQVDCAVSSTAVNKNQLSLLKAKTKLPLHQRGIRSPSAVTSSSRNWGRQTSNSNSTTILRTHSSNSSQTRPSTTSSSFASPAICYSRDRLRKATSSMATVGSASTNTGSSSSPSPGRSAEVSPSAEASPGPNSGPRGNSPNSISDSLSPADMRTKRATVSKALLRSHANTHTAEYRRLFAHLLLLQSVLPLTSLDMKEVLCTPKLVSALHQLILISRPWGFNGTNISTSSTPRPASATASVSTITSTGGIDSTVWSPTQPILFTAICATVAAVLHGNATMKTVIATLSCSGLYNTTTINGGGDNNSHSSHVMSEHHCSDSCAKERGGGALLIHYLLGVATSSTASNTFSSTSNNSPHSSGSARVVQVHPFIRRFYLSLVYSMVNTGAVVSISQKSALSLGVIRHLSDNLTNNTHERLQPECVLLLLDALTAMVCNSSEYTNHTSFGSSSSTCTNSHGAAGGSSNSSACDNASVVSNSTYSSNSNNYNSYNHSHSHHLGSRMTKMKLRNNPNCSQTATFQQQQQQIPSSASFVDNYINSCNTDKSNVSQVLVPLPELLDLVLESYLTLSPQAATNSVPNVNITSVNNFLLTIAVLRSIGKIALTAALAGNRRMLTVATHEKCLIMLLQNGWLDSLRALLKCIPLGMTGITVGATSTGITTAITSDSDLVYYGSTCLMTALTSVWLLINNSESARATTKKTLNQYGYKLLYRQMNAVILYLTTPSISISSNPFSSAANNNNKSNSNDHNIKSSRCGEVVEVISRAWISIYQLIQ